MRMIIGADFVPTESNIENFYTGKMDQIVSKSLFEILKGADYRIFNMELPLTDKKNPIKKCGPHFFALPAAICGYKKMRVDMVTVSNNHIFDQGARGLKMTLETLEAAGISYSGAGMTRAEAIVPHVIEKDGIRIGVYCCTEHEFSVRGEEEPGANPFDPLESLDHIYKLKQQVDFVICLYHGGKEYYRYPSPNLQKTCRKIVEKGADLVLCQHSHCIGCEENWKDGKIIYGQGNFLFDHSKKEEWQTGLLVEIELNKNKVPIYKLIALRKDGNGVRMANEREKKEIFAGYIKRSEEILQKDFINQQYKKFSNEIIDTLLGRFDIISSTVAFRVINRLAMKKLKPWYYKNVLLKKKRYQMINAIECEAWREAFIEGLKSLE